MTIRLMGATTFNRFDTYLTNCNCEWRAIKPDIRELKQNLRVGKVSYANPSMYQYVGSIKSKKRLDQIVKLLAEAVSKVA